MSEASDSAFRVGHNALARSKDVFRRAEAVLPGGTTRVTVQRDPTPIYMAQGSGAWLTDLDGNRYLDFNNNYTTLIHGHAFEPAVAAIERQVRAGTCFANPTEHEVAHAEILSERVPSVERVRYVNTGTEAVMYAVKAARAITGRAKVAKLEGAYHGGYDWVEVSENSTPETWGGREPASVPFARGTPPSVLEEVVVVPINDPETTAALLERHAEDLACFVLDLVPSRAGLIPLKPDYLATVREITRRHGIILVSDEVLNFRQGYRGAAARFGLEPDLIALGKIIGGGLPIGAVAGPADLMAVFDNSRAEPALPQGGTFSANPLSMVAGIASLQALDRAAFDRLEVLGIKLRGGLERAIEDRGLPITVTGTASLFRVHLKPLAPRSYREAWPTAAEQKLLKGMSRFLLDRGVILPALSSSSLSTAMTDADIEFFLASFAEFLDTEEVRGFSARRATQGQMEDNRI